MHAFGLIARRYVCFRSDGGCSSPGRAPDCGSGGSGFETRQPPHPFCAQVAKPRLGEALRVICLLTALSQILPSATCLALVTLITSQGAKRRGAIHAPKSASQA